MVITVAFTFMAFGCEKKPSTEERLAEVREQIERAVQIGEAAADRPIVVEVDKRLLRVLNNSDKNSLKTPVLVSPWLRYWRKDKSYYMEIHWVGDVPNANGFEIRSHDSSIIRLPFDVEMVELNRVTSRTGCMVFDAAFLFEADGNEWRQLGTPKYGTKLEGRLLQGEKPVTEYVEILWAAPFIDNSIGEAEPE